MDKTARTFPDTELMLCSGGGGRVDYGALKYFQEFWPSDNTDPIVRVPMQWDYSYFFPSMAHGQPRHALGQPSDALRVQRGDERAVSAWTSTSRNCRHRTRPYAPGPSAPTNKSAT